MVFHQMSEQRFERDMERIMQSTNIIATPELDERFGVEGYFWLYSVGMKDNYDMPDIEMRGVPGMLMRSAMSSMNEINAYRLSSEKPILVGQTVSWGCGNIRVHQADDWDGRYQWKAEDMLRLMSRDTDVPGCSCCDRSHIEE
jgi:hypothetical protein